LQRIPRGSLEIDFLAHLHGPDTRAVDGQQQVAVGLQMMRARVRRAGDEIDRFGIFRIAHVDDRDAIGKAVADISKAPVDHDLHAVAAAALVAVAEEFDFV
jgi:hypothetical protein